MACPLCEKRKPKRPCPARGDLICARCCGEQREVSIECPFECSYLRESRNRDHKGIHPKDFPYNDIQIDDQFIRRHAELLSESAQQILAGFAKIPGAVDTDVQQALDGLIRTQKTLDSGLYYDSRPDAAFAAALFDHLQEALRAFRETDKQRVGFTRVHEADILKVLVFLYRMGLDRDNGRLRGRAFLDFLTQHFSPTAPEQEPLIVPGF